MLDWFFDRDGEAGSSHGPQTLTGLVAGTTVATPLGWRPVETLNAGDTVLTFDHGPQRLRTIVRRLYPAPHLGQMRPLIRIPARAIGNVSAMLMLPGQGVLVESDLAEEIWGDPFALITAEALAAWPGASAVLPEAPVVAVALGFERDEVVFADGQALMHFEGVGMAQPSTLDTAVFGEDGAYRMLGRGEARVLAAELARETKGAARLA